MIFLLDSQGRLGRPHAVRCEDKQEAARKAELLRGSGEAEVWLQGRFVARVGKGASTCSQPPSR